MRPIPFKEQNVVFAKNQPEYQPLPAYADSEGTVVSCWKMSWRERLRVLFTGKLWVIVMTFKSKLQPMLLDVNIPFSKEKETTREGSPK